MPDFQLPSIPLLESLKKVQEPHPNSPGVSYGALRMDAGSAIKFALSAGSIKETFLFSLSDPFPRPVWMPADDYKTACNSIWSSFRQTFSQALAEKYDPVLAKVPEAAVRELGTKLSITGEKLEPVWAAIRAKLSFDLLVSIRIAHWNSIHTALLYYQLFHLLNNQRACECLYNIIQLAPVCFPLGELADRPGTWIVAVA